MHLERLEIQGFKTFAKKSVFTFLPPKSGRFPITAVVGQNGSGKSNGADAIRWVLGEQSLKLLRGKQSDDIIFSGSEGKSRSGFAEVSITLNNEDHSMPIDFGRVVVTRRLFRDGTSEYVLNEAKVRLQDIQLLLAQANIGQRSYSVIGQGMVDHILIASPEERKAFFDDATGVKPLQIKRHEASLKLKRTQENLKDAEMVLLEIEPRVRSLRRQTKRLEERALVEAELRALEKSYYGFLWWQMVDEKEAVDKSLGHISQKLTDVFEQIKILEEKTQTVEEKEVVDDGMKEMQAQYRTLQKTRDDLRRTQFETEKTIELTKIKAQSNWAPLPLSRIIEEVKGIAEAVKAIKAIKAVKEIHEAIEKILEQSTGLSKRLERPNPEDIKPDVALTEKLKKINTQEQGVEAELKTLEKNIDAYATKEHKERTELIAVQRALREKQQERHAMEQEKNTYEIERARLEERAQALTREMDEFMKEEGKKVREGRKGGEAGQETHAQIQRLRYKLELIGGIDPEIICEYEQTKQRFEFLDAQVSDLQKALRSTEKIIEELDEHIELQSKKVFQEINKKFQYYFKVLFDGGSCELTHVMLEASEGSEDQKSIAGIDIQATPPGKRLKALNLLSGGERALTSIALLSAIMDVNPAPFVVLDEVDASLDEANTIRFAAILEELAQKSQFIVITHNRATMEKADVLYGVTMGDNGISNLLSVHLEDIANSATARR